MPKKIVSQITYAILRQFIRSFCQMKGVFSDFRFHSFEYQCKMRRKQQQNMKYLVTARMAMLLYKKSNAAAASSLPGGYWLAACDRDPWCYCFQSSARTPSLDLMKIEGNSRWLPICKAWIWSQISNRNFLFSSNFRKPCEKFSGIMYVLPLNWEIDWEPVIGLILIRIVLLVSLSVC